MSDEVKETDLLAVSRDNASYQVPYSDINELLDTDLFAVSRDGVNYKVEAQYVNRGNTGTIGTPVSVLTPLNGAGTNDGEPYNPLSSAITAVGTSGDVVYQTDTIANVYTDSAYNQTQDWNTVVGVTGVNIEDDTDRLWNTDPNQGVASHRNNNSGSLILTFPEGFLDGKLVEFYQTANESDRNDKCRYAFGTGNPNGVAYYTGYAGWRSIGTAPAGMRQISCYKNTTAASNWFGGIRVDGKMIVSPEYDDSNYQGEVLTFPTSKDFDKFEVGDKVQGYQYSKSTTVGDVPTKQPLENAFDGNLSTYVMEDSNNNTCTWTFDTPITGTFFEMYGTSNYASGPGGVIQVNGQAGDVVPAAAMDWGNFSAMANGSFQSFELRRVDGQANPAIAAFRVDGHVITDVPVASITAIDAAGPTITTDGGSWAGSDGSGAYVPPSQVWSSTVTSDKPITMGSLADLFNGQANTQVGMKTGESGSRFILTFSTPITNVTKVEVGAYTYGNGQSFNEYQMNGQAKVSNPYNAYDEVLVIYEGDSTTLSSIEVIASNTGVPPWLKYIKVNDVLLVDPGLPNIGAPETKVFKTVTSEASLTFTDDTELANMVGPLTQVDENGDVKTPVTSEIVSVASTTSVYSDYITGKQGLLNPTNAFDGSTSTMCQDFDGVFNVQNNYQLTFTPPSPISFTSKVEVFSEGGPGAPYGNRFQVDLGSGLGSPIDSIVNTWVTVATGSGSLHQLVAKADMNACSIGGIRVDDVILTDAATITAKLLTFATPNPDLKYFQPGDDVGTKSGFAPVIYTGSGSTQSIKCGFSPDLVWTKSRSLAELHLMNDSLRGVPKNLYPSSTQAQDASNYVSALTSDGFTVNGNAPAVNQSGATYVAWCWKASDTTVTNNEGTIESQVRSNGNFSICKFDSPSAYDNSAWGHGLSSAPEFVILKLLNGSSDWTVYHAGAPSKYFFLNSAAEGAGSNNWTVTSTTVSPGAGLWTALNAPHIAYAWAETPGVSSFGTYDGTGASQTIECGFKPAYLIYKCASSGSTNWHIFDNKRGAERLIANTSESEGSPAAYAPTFTDTGFTVANVSDTHTNASGQTYIYAAFAVSNPIEVIDVDVANNTMTVDGGDWHGTNDWNQSEEWSDLLAPTSEITNGTNATQLFNADLTDGIFIGATGTSGSWDVTFTTSIPCTSLEIYIPLKQVNADGEVSINGGTNVPVTGVGWLTLPPPEDGTLTTIKLVRLSVGDGNNGLLYGAIKVNGKPLVDPSVTPTGETQVTGQPLVATANDVDYLDGNTLGVSDVSGTWFPGLYAQGAEVTEYAPSPGSIVFTSMNEGSTPFTGTDATLASRVWTLEKSSKVTGPWTEVGVYIDYGANDNQDGATPWNNPDLEPNTFYQVKVEYTSSNAESETSTFNTFKTGDA